MQKLSGFAVLLVAMLAVWACSNDTTQPRHIPPADSTAKTDTTKHPG